MKAIHIKHTVLILFIIVYPIIASLLFSDNYGNPFILSNIVLLLFYPVLLGSLTYLFFKPKNIFIFNNWAKTVVLSGGYIILAFIILFILVMAGLILGEYLQENNSTIFSLFFYTGEHPDYYVNLKQSSGILILVMGFLFSTYIGKRILKSKYVQDLFDIYEN